jgi:exopolysaccharide production protein ExoZ
MAKPNHRLQFTLLQAGRGVAALLVVFYHLGSEIFGNPKFWSVRVDGGLFSFGHQGVAFFFVLSGFIILHAHLDELGRPERWGRYVHKRAMRIYLPYWLVLFPLIAVYIAFPALGKPAISSPAVMLNSPMLIGGNSRSTLAVAWTLFHEVTFYAIFGVAVLHRGIGTALLIIWQLACALSLASLTPLHYSLDPINLLFGMGMIARLVIGRWTIPAPRAVMLAGMAIFASLGAIVDYSHLIGGHTSSILFGVSSFLFLVGGVEAERRGLITAPVALRRLGDASYAIYLVHFPVLSVLARILHVGPLSDIPAPIAYLLLATGAISAGLIFHQLAEKPMQRRISRYQGKRGLRAAL